MLELNRTPAGYTMRTPAVHSPGVGAAQSHAHAHSHSHSLSHSSSIRSARQNRSSTPVASPRLPYSVGQNHAPKLSPRIIPDARAPSPNYFGLVVERGDDPRDSSGLPRETWSPSSSSVKSFAAAIPNTVPVPLDANPEFESFKKQCDLNRGKSMSMSMSTPFFKPATPNGASLRPRPPQRWHTHSSESGNELPTARTIGSIARERPVSRMDIDQEACHDSAYGSSESKRSSDASFVPMHLGNIPRFESPQLMEPPRSTRNSLTRAEDTDPRLSIMEHKVDPPSPGPNDIRRAATVPLKMESGQSNMISAAQLRDLLETVDKNRLMILDMRSAQNYRNGRVQGALNLCVPTTLLKRATFNLGKLQQMFSRGADSTKFGRWKDMDCIVVYDSHASDKRDSVAAQNMIKKFVNEGYKGKTCILRGGFTAFQPACPDLVDHLSPSDNAEPSAGMPHGSNIAPVIGGVSLPSSDKDQNPFFSNIRQNMDLADGVGQFEVNRPTALESPALPRWLREAASKTDHGKKVSDKFLHIEVDEQARMKAAYAAFNPNSKTQCSVQLCGVEKGGKNRYKDILPFEHARVKLQDKPAGACDYVNASHLQASRSNKRYIATQGPLPATFEDFWSVIWEQDVRVIVMLTAESEGGQLKCHSYWKGRDFGAIRLKPLSEKKVSLDIDKHRSESHASPSSSGIGEYGRRRANTLTTLGSTSASPKPQQSQGEIPYVIVRKFALSHASHPFAPIREITHLHFPAWPDFGTPAQPSHLLALVELANVMQRSALPVETTSVVGSRRSSIEASPPITWYDEPEADANARPMLVHCSAGCGRTGTFCTVDSVIDMLKRQRQAKISALRGQDAEGDVAMSGAGDVSPRTNKGFDFKVKSPRGDIEKRMAQGPAPTDTTWVFDDTIDLIQKTVEDFREQRLSMVQSLRQFVLCYETILEWVSRMNDRGASAPTGRMRSGSLQQPRR